MEKAVTYWGKVDANGDGVITEDEIAAALKKSETFYQFKPSAKRGEEVADVTLNYYRDGVTVRDTTVYFYEGNLRADEATIRTGLERSATFWGNAVDVQELVDAKVRFLFESGFYYQIFTLANNLLGAIW